ncbi:MAG: DUF99 family protein [Candidatus Altiarchaeota archaeon]|nr:DUF99 family protein [Candidatus Altiarchaeota archaeon]
MPIGGLNWRDEPEPKRFRQIKDEVQVLGIDDAPFQPESKEVRVVATLFRGGKTLDGVFRTKISKDGLDATNKLIELIKEIERDNIRALLLDGITFGGFNIVDVQRLYAETGIPVIVSMQKRPNFADIRRALRHLDNYETRTNLIEKAGSVHPIDIVGKKVFIQKAGISLEDAKGIIEKTTTNGLVPEPIRVAHLIGKGTYGKEEMAEEGGGKRLDEQVRVYISGVNQRVTGFKHKWMPGWIGEIFTFLFAFLLAYLFIQGLGFVLNTSSPLVVVESESMIHSSNWQQWLADNGLTPSAYGFDGGMGIGDIIIVKGDDTYDINVGDVIIYQKLECERNAGGEPIIHRVVGIVDVDGGNVNAQGAVRFEDGLIKTPCNDYSSSYDLQSIKDRYADGRYFKDFATDKFRLFITKGDGNQREDQCRRGDSCEISYPIHNKLIVGTAKFDIPWLGYIKLGLVCGLNYATGNACSSKCWWTKDNPRCRGA